MIKSLNLVGISVRGALRRAVANVKDAVANPKAGMELVQVAILIAIAVVVGLIFRTQIMRFVNGVFGDLMDAGF